MFSFFEDILFVLPGIIVTIQIFLGSSFLGFAMALFLLPYRTIGITRFVINRIISLIRGTPIILQLTLIFYCLSSLFPDINVIFVATITLGLNSFAYISEIFRSAMHSKYCKQYNIYTTSVLNIFVISRILKKSIPILVSELISLLKETSIVTFIGGVDIMKRTELLYNQNFHFISSLFIAGFCYYMIVVLIEYLGNVLENNINY